MSQRSIPTVSVVMPAYNAEQYIAEAIESILNQTFTDFEFIIINDGSTDNTVDIIKNYSDPRIVFLENEQNSGICVTLNKGLDAARGKYIARMDSDDISVPERLEEQVKFMDQHQDIAASGTDIYIFGKGIADYKFDMVHDAKQCKAGLFFNSCFAHPSVIIRASMLNGNKLRYDDDFRGLEDYELWWQISKYGKVANLDKMLLLYRKHPNQVTQNIPQKTRDALDRFMSIRLRDLGIHYTDAELNLFRMYCYGEFNNFDESTLNSYMNFMKRVISEGNGIIDKSALKLTIAKSISYILICSPSLKRKKKRYTIKAFQKGVMPLIWTLKQLK